jgi:hypothetical protein
MHWSLSLALFWGNPPSTEQLLCQDAVNSNYLIMDVCNKRLFHLEKGNGEVEEQREK